MSKKPCVVEVTLLLESDLLRRQKKALLRAIDHEQEDSEALQSLVVLIDLLLERTLGAEAWEIEP